jgi:hypothetical protein
MALISKSFPQSTRPSLQTLQRPLARSGKCLKGRAKAALTRSSLQTSSRAADGVAAVAPLRDCSRSIAGDGNRVGGWVNSDERTWVNFCERQGTFDRLARFDHRQTLKDGPSIAIIAALIGDSCAGQYGMALMKVEFSGIVVSRKGDPAISCLPIPMLRIASRRW